VTAQAGLNDVHWAPTELTNTIEWLDASDTSSLWADTNGTVQATNTVARWNDKSEAPTCPAVASEARRWLIHRNRRVSPVPRL